MDIKFLPEGRTSSYYSFDSNNISLGYDKNTKYYSYPSGSSRYEFEQLLCCDGTFYNFYNDNWRLGEVLDSSLCWGQWLHLDYSYDFTGLSNECIGDDEHCCDYAYKVYYGFTDVSLLLDYSFKSSSYEAHLFDDFTYEYCSEDLYFGSFDEDCNFIDYVYTLAWSGVFSYYPVDESVEFQYYLDRVDEAYNDLLNQFSDSSRYCSNIGEIIYHQDFWGYKECDAYFDGRYGRIVVACGYDDEEISDYNEYLNCLNEKFNQEVEIYRNDFSDFRLIGEASSSINCSFWATCSISAIEAYYWDVDSGYASNWSCRDGYYYYDKKVLGYYSDGSDVDNKVKISLSDSNGFIFPDSAFYIVLNIYDYLDCGVDRCEFPLFLKDFNNGGNDKLNVVSGGKFKITPITRQIVGCIKISNNKVYLIEQGFLGSDDEALHSFCVSDDENVSVKSFDIYEYYLKGSVISPKFHNLNNFGHCFNFELVEVSAIMACSDECMLGLIDAINNFRSALTDDTSEINVNLADISEAIKNYQFVISFPKSYDVNVKEVPCLNFCQGATLSANISGLPAVMPVFQTSITAFPTDWLGGLISAIGSIVATLLQKDLSVTNQITVPSSSVIVQPSTATIQNTVNIPDSISISELPCIDFCEGASLAVNVEDMPCIDFCEGASLDVNVEDMPCIDFCEGASLDVNVKEMPDLVVGFPNKFLVEISKLPSLIIGEFPDIFNSSNFLDCFTSCMDVGLAEMFSEAFNKSDCSGSVFKKTNSIGQSSEVLTISDLFSNTFLSRNLLSGSLDKSVFRSLLGIDIATCFANAFNLLDGSGSVFSNNNLLDYKTFYDDFDEVTHNCNLGISELFSNAFNLTNCQGSVFKANDNNWSGEDSLAGIWYKQLDYGFVSSNNYNSAFYLKLSSSSLFNLPNLFYQSFFDGSIPSHSSSSFNFSDSLSFTDVLKRAFFSVPDSGSPSRNTSHFSIGLSAGNDFNKILNHHCDCNPNSIKFCEDLKLSSNSVVNIGDLPDVQISNNNNNPISVETNQFPDNIFVNSDGKTTRYTSEVFK